jgi:hypothetical protein
MLTPIPRYVTCGCCTDPDHVVNRADPEYKTKMMQGLDALKRNLKDFKFRDGKRSMKLLDPNVDLRGLEEDDIWGVSSVYAKVAAGIVKMAGDLSGKRRRTDSMEAAPQAGLSRGRGTGQNTGSKGAVRQPSGWTHGGGGGRGVPMRGAMRGANSDYRRPRGVPSYRLGRGYYYYKRDRPHQ